MGELIQAIRQIHSGQLVFDKKLKSEYEDRYSTRERDSLGTIEEELQIFLPPDMNSEVATLWARLDQTLQSSALHRVGYWKEGTVWIFLLNKATSLTSALELISNMPEIKAVGEKPLGWTVNPEILKEAEGMPGPYNRIRKTIFITLKED